MMGKIKSMSEFFAPTRFACLKSWQSRLIIFVLVVIIGWGIFLSSNQGNNMGASRDGNTPDSLLYLRIVERVHAGEDYYSVAGSELRSLGYATRPVFNWRPPLLACFLGKLSSPEIGRWLLILLTLLTLAMWTKVLGNKGGFYMALLGSFLLLGSTAFSVFSRFYLFHELWAGVFISFSIVTYKRNRKLSVISGLLALFIRELSLPFVIMMLFMACKDKQKKEAAAWLFGIFTFFIYLAIHATVVSGLITESDLTNKTWVQLGAWPFVLSTARWTLVSVLSPIWLNAVLLPLAVLSLWGWRGNIGVRAALTISMFVLLFLVVGRKDNYYWGFMYAPMMAVGLVYSPPCLFDLYKTGLKRNT
jgi:hypothetical protein